MINRKKVKERKKKERKIKRERKKKKYTQKKRMNESERQNTLTQEKQNNVQVDKIAKNENICNEELDKDANKERKEIRRKFIKRKMKY